jgi:hypothetical protein
MIIIDRRSKDQRLQKQSNVTCSYIPYNAACLSLSPAHALPMRRPCPCFRDTGPMLPQHDRLMMAFHVPLIDFTHNILPAGLQLLTSLPTTLSFPLSLLKQAVHFASFHPIATFIKSHDLRIHLSRGPISLDSHESETGQPLEDWTGQDNPTTNTFLLCYIINRRVIQVPGSQAMCLGREVRSTFS